MLGERQVVSAREGLDVAETTRKGLESHSHWQCPGEETPDCHQSDDDLRAVVGSDISYFRTHVAYGLVSGQKVDHRLVKLEKSWE